MMLRLWLLIIFGLALGGCNSADSTNTASADSRASAGDSRVPEITTLPALDNLDTATSMTSLPAAEMSNNVGNEHLLRSRLSPEQLKEGWVRLYDGYEMTGWFYIGNANWTFADGTITVDGGDSSMLCSNFQVSDFELLVDFYGYEKTDSGICLRSSADPRDPSRDCYELNIAPNNIDYPTGSLVGRQKVDPEVVGEVASKQWHTYRVVAEGDRVKVWLDGKPILEYTDARKLRRGYIGLQYNSGVVRFRNILMRPLGGQDLALGEDWDTAWKPLENAAKEFRAESTGGGLRLINGPGQLESKQQFDDFILQATYKVANDKVDSGILFRGLAGRYNEAYECQIYHGRFVPSSAKTTGRLQTGSLNIPAKNDPTNARVLASDGLTPTYMTIIADEGQFTSFVNGVLVADVADTREVSANPRTGFRREAGKIALQAQDENCDITFQRLSVTPLYKR